MKTWKKLLATLLAVAMLLSVLSACNNDPKPTDPTGTSKPTEPEQGKKYTVTFYNNGEVYETVEYAEGATLTLPKAPKGEKGKGLYGWTTIDGDMEEVINPDATVVNADMKLYALWADVYDVVINLDNGDPFTVLEVFAGTIIPQPANPVKEGYRFVEWRDALNEVPFDFSQPIYADVTIKAMYGDGAANRVSETKWDFSTGVHGSWVGDQSAWGKVESNGIACKDMVYYTVDENGYAAWGYTKADAEGNIPTEITGNDPEGYGMKILCNEGVSVEASKAKLVVLYVKAQYFPIDVFRMSLLTSKGGKIYGYGAGQEDWAIRTDTANKDLVQVDLMEDGWYRVQYKIHGLPIWSEDAIIKGFSFGIVQRPQTPVMDIISVKSIELLDQEEFIDPHQIEYITKDHWDMSNADESKDWVGAQQNGADVSNVTTTVDSNGTTYVYRHTNAWRGLTMSQAKIDMSKLSGVFTIVLDTNGMAPSNYRLYIKTDAGGDLYKNDREDVSCYYTVTKTDELTDGWTVIANADGTLTITYDLTKLEYWNQGTTLLGLTFVTVDKTTNGTVIYKSISLVDAEVKHDCTTDGHAWIAATCDKAKTCSVCGETEGKALGHSWKKATCTEPKTCKRCGATSGDPKGHSWDKGVCTVCGEQQVIEVPGPSWDMSKTEDSNQWYSAQNKNVTDKSYITVTENGSVVTYTHTNGWKGIVLTNQNININELSGKLYVTYSSTLNITQYRIYVLTDVGGDLAFNDEPTSGFAPENYYIAMKVEDIAGSEYWTLTENADGTVTVCFDLKSLPFFANGNALRGLTFCTVANSETGDVIYKEIKLTGKQIVSAEDECERNGHTFKNATCTSPKTCSVCGATEGKALGHTWTDATCTSPKTCSVCRATEGEALGHTWVDATCTSPKTCSVCGGTEGEPAPHNYADGVCTNCGAYEVDPVTQNSWDMTKAEDSAHWIALQDKIKTEWASTALAPEGTVASYTNNNAWKGLQLKNALIEINENTSHLTFTYSTALSVTQYRIYILTDKGGNLGYNDEATSGYAPANYYIAMKLGDIAASDAWTSKTNEDGTVTVTFDLTTLPFYKDGTVLNGLTIVTVASSVGDVTYKSIALTEKPKDPCEENGHTWVDATCDTPKTCSVCGATEGDPAAHNYVDGVCSNCGAYEVPPVTQNNWDMTKAEDSAHWVGLTDKTHEENVTVTITEAGSTISYADAKAWKGIRMNNALIEINEHNTHLTFTYSTALSVTQYRIYVLTDLGGDLAYNDEPTSGYAPANYYVAMKLSDIAASDAWTSTTNDDGTITVTFDLTTLPFYKDGTTLKGLTIVTVSGNVAGDVTYKSIALTEAPATEEPAHDCEKDGHIYENGVCTICGEKEPVTQSSWDMSKEEDANQWYSAQNKTVTDKSYITVTENGSVVTYTHTNGWKGIRLENAEIQIGDLTHLTFTYSSTMTISKFRIYILTDLGGHLTENAEKNSGYDPAKYFAEIALADIGDGTAWTSVANEDGTFTVTLDLTSLPFYQDGTVLKGLTICTVTGSVTGDVTYKSIALTEKQEVTEEPAAPQALAYVPAEKKIHL